MTADSYMQRKNHTPYYGLSGRVRLFWYFIGVTGIGGLVLYFFR